MLRKYQGKRIGNLALDSFRVLQPDPSSIVEFAAGDPSVRYFTHIRRRAEYLTRQRAGRMSTMIRETARRGFKRGVIEKIDGRD
jgi:hypothetical protein